MVVRARYFLILLLGNEFAMVSRAVTDVGYLMPPAKKRATASEFGPCCCKIFDPADESRHPWWSSRMPCSRRPGSNGLQGELTGVERSAAHAYNTIGETVRTGNTTLGGEGTLCCKERATRCDKWPFGYWRQLRGGRPGCGKAASSHPPGRILRAQHQNVVNLTNDVSRPNAGKIKGPWDGGRWMWYVGATNAGRGTASAVVGASDAAEAISEFVASTVGEAVAPVGMVLGPLGIATSEQQIREWARNYNMAKTPEESRYIECQVRNQRTNQAVTVFVLVNGAVGLAVGWTGIGAAIIASSVLAIVVGNRVRSRWACSRQEEAMAALQASEKEEIRNKIAQVIAAAMEADPDLAEDLNPEVPEADIHTLPEATGSDMANVVPGVNGIEDSVRQLGGFRTEAEAAVFSQRVVMTSVTALARMRIAARKKGNQSNPRGRNVAAKMRESAAKMRPRSSKSSAGKLSDA